MSIGTWWDEELMQRFKAKATRASNVASSKKALIDEYERLGYVVVWNRNAGYDPFVYLKGSNPKTATRRIRLQDRTVRREIKIEGQGWMKSGKPISHKITLAALQNL